MFSARDPYTPPQTGPAPRSVVYPAHSNFSAYHASQEPESKVLEESLRPKTSCPTPDTTTFGSTVPLSALHGTGAYRDHHDLRPLTAPVYEQRELERGLPPERSLPFSTQPTSKPNRKAENALKTVDEPDRPHHRAAANLSENDPDVVAGNSARCKGQVLAADIDTQLLLARVKARKSNVSKNRENETTRSKQLPMGQSQTTVPLKKPTRNIRCLHCRSKRRKCDRNEDNPNGTCVPCASAGVKCSFAADTDSHPNAAESTQQIIQVPNSQEEDPQASQSLRASRRLRGASPIDVRAVSSRVAHPDANTRTQSAGKRASQLAMPAPKRVKLTKQDGKKHNREQTSEKSTTIGAMRPQATSETISKKSEQAPKSALLSSDNIRSDATTATATTLDLDPNPTSVLAKTSKLFTKARETSLQAACSRAAPDLGKAQQKPSAVPPNATTANASDSSFPKEKSEKAQEMCKIFMTSDLSEFLTMNLDERDKALDSLFSTALFSDEFLEFAKVVETRWDNGMFDGNI